MSDSKLSSIPFNEQMQGSEVYLFNGMSKEAEGTDEVSVGFVYS
jgi:hypothetical protein